MDSLSSHQSCVLRRLNPKLALEGGVDGAEMSRTAWTSGGLIESVIVAGGEGQ